MMIATDPTKDCVSRSTVPACRKPVHRRETSDSPGSGIPSVIFFPTPLVEPCNRWSPEPSSATINIPEKPLFFRKKSSATSEQGFPSLDLSKMQNSSFGPRTTQGSQNCSFFLQRRPSDPPCLPRRKRSSAALNLS